MIFSINVDVMFNFISKIIFIINVNINFLVSVDVNLYFGVYVILKICVNLNFNINFDVISKLVVI